MRPVVDDLVSIARAPGLTRTALERLRDRKLQRIVRHACRHVPFYRERFRAAGVRAQDVRTAADLVRVPVAERDALQSAGVEARLASGYRREECAVLHTSGSTGQPLEVRLSRWDSRIRRLVELRTMRRAGLRMRDRLVTVGPSRSLEPALHQRLGFYRTEIVSGLLPVEEQIEALRRLRPDAVWIYPGALGVMYERGFRLRDVISPRQFYFSGETMPEPMRERLRDDLGIEPIDFYGCLEVGRVAAQCPAGDGLHVNLDHAIVEIVREPGGPADAGSVLLTALNAYAMPILRYRVGDLAAWRDGRCGCGSVFPRMTPPLGRAYDCLTLPGGRLVTVNRCRFALRVCPGLLRYQIIEEAVGRLTVKIVTEGRPAAGMADRLRAALIENLGELVAIEVEFVDHIPQEGLKFREFVSRVEGQAPGR